MSAVRPARCTDGPGELQAVEVRNASMPAVEEIVTTSPQRWGIEPRRRPSKQFAMLLGSAAGASTWCSTRSCDLVQSNAWESCPERASAWFSPARTSSTWSLKCKWASDFGGVGTGGPSMITGTISGAPCRRQPSWQGRD